MPYLVENLKEIGQEAKDHGIILAIESHDAWTASDICARLMRLVDHPNVRMLWIYITLTGPTVKPQNTPTATSRPTRSISTSRTRSQMEKADIPMSCWGKGMCP